MGGNSDIKQILIAIYRIRYRSLCLILLHIGSLNDILKKSRFKNKFKKFTKFPSLHIANKMIPEL